MIDLAKIRTGVYDLVRAAVPDTITVLRYPPDDLTDAPLVYIDLSILSGSSAINGGTTVSFPVVVVSTRTDHAYALDRLEELVAAVWAAFGDGKSVEVPPGMRGSCRAANPEQMSVADTTWPAMRFAVDVEVGLVC